MGLNGQSGKSDHFFDKQRSFVDHNSIRLSFASLQNVEKNWETRRYT